MDSLSTKYTVEYFLNLFKQLRPGEVGTGHLHHHCAAYHCGIRDTGRLKSPRLRALAKLFRLAYGKRLAGADSDYEAVWTVNDGGDFPGGSARQRIICALNKAKQKIQRYAKTK